MVENLLAVPFLNALILHVSYLFVLVSFLCVCAGEHVCVYCVAIKLVSTTVTVRSVHVNVLIQCEFFHLLQPYCKHMGMTLSFTLCLTSMAATICYILGVYTKHACISTNMYCVYI